MSAAAPQLHPTGVFADFGSDSARGFVIDLGTRPLSGFVVRRHNSYYAYINSCPHTGVELNWQTDAFLSYDQHYIACSLHGALFTLERGYCVYGPCVGRSLTPLALEIRNGEIHVGLA